MYINTFDINNPHEMLHTENKFMWFDTPLQECSRSRDKMSLILNSPAVNEFFKDAFPYWRLSPVYLTLLIEDGVLCVSYRRRIFHRFTNINPYAYHHVRCTNEELETIIQKIYREDCKNPVFLETTFLDCLIANKENPKHFH